MLIRAKFCKEDKVRYISHLELMSTFRRSFRRAEIPMAYSRGYNPHPIFALGQPLPVGMSGRGEYFDLEIEEEFDPEDFTVSVNRKLPDGLKIIKARRVTGDTKSLMAVINTAVYDIKMNFTGFISAQSLLIKEFLAQKKIIIIRKRRKKEARELDIKPLIDNIEVLEPELWRFTVRTGSSGNLRPEEVISSLVNFNEIIKPVPLINIEREGLYIKKGKVLYQPYDEEVIGS